MKNDPVEIDTLLTQLGRDPFANHGIVNPPVYHASTILWRSVEDMELAYKPGSGRLTYGRVGTPTSQAFEIAAAALEGGAGAVSTPSGLSAISLALTALTAAGSHVLMTDSCYGPTRRFCDGTLARFGVEVEYYDPRLGGGLAGLIRPNTRLIYMESPGSLTFEVQDVPEIVRTARTRGIVTVVDNTWATPVFFRPFALGVDVVLHAATKYMGGHADVNMGVVVGRTEAEAQLLRRAATQMGLCAGPDDHYLALRGLRTMAVRLRRHQKSALAIARWLAERKEVQRVLHPGLPTDPGHLLWRRDFTGSTGLFGVVLKPVSWEAVKAMLDGMKIFQMGESWGGYESLILPCHPERYRTATSWDASHPLIRLHVGLEDPRDLIADLEAGFDRLRAAS